MQNTLSPIWQYIGENHVISVTVHDGRDFWSFNAFYAVGPEQQALVIFSSTSTRHGRLMSANPQVSGTISDQVADFTQLKGLQFSGTINQLDGAAKEHAIAVYLAKFPFASNMPKEAVWKISFSELKLTDNSLGFGTKIEWKKP